VAGVRGGEPLEQLDVVLEPARGEHDRIGVARDGPVQAPAAVAVR
jgi:hypothetical protein